MTDDEVNRKWPGSADRLRQWMATYVAHDGYISPMGITADQIDDILCHNYGGERGQMTEADVAAAEEFRRRWNLVQEARKKGSGG